jgi:protein SCO1/2
MLRLSSKSGIILTIIILVVVAFIAWPDSEPTSVLDEYLQATAPPVPENIFVGDEIIPPVPAPEFDLINFSGDQVSNADFSGKVVLLSFAYTSCPDTCPVLFGRFLAIQEQLSQAIGNDLELVFISVDPEVDTPERLSAHVAAMQGKWFYLTDELSIVEEVWSNFNLYVEKEGSIVGHTNLTILIDQQGLARVQYIGLPPESVFINDIENLLAKE